MRSSPSHIPHRYNRCLPAPGPTHAAYTCMCTEEARAQAAVAQASLLEKQVAALEENKQRESKVRGRGGGRWRVG